MRSTFKTLFYINRQKAKADGSCPVMGRITIDRRVSQYYTGEDINPDLWDVKAGRVLVKGRDSKEKQLLKDINIRLNELEQHAQAAYKSIVDAIGYVSSEMVRNAVTGRAQAKETLISLMDEHNEEYEKRVGIDRVYHTYVRYLTTRKHLYNFLQYKYDVEDIPLRSLDIQFIKDFHFYLSTVLRIKTISLNDYLILLRKMGRLAVKQRTLKRDPFAG